MATEEKAKIELRQREKDLERKHKFIEYKSNFFTYNSLNKEWLYNYFDLRPWDTLTDLFQYEYDYKIKTRTKHDITIITKRVLNDPHASLLSLQHLHDHHDHIQHRHQTRSLHHNRKSDSLTNEETSFDILIHFSDIKQRLDKIEDNLKHLDKKLDAQSIVKTSMNRLNRESFTTENDLFLKQFKSFSCVSIWAKSILNSPGLLIFLIAWVLGLITSLVSKKIFSKLF